MKKSIALLAGLLLVSSTGFAASLHSLNKNQITQLIANHTFTTISAVTLNGEIENNTFTGYWNKDGQMKGQFANKPDNDPVQDQGKWMVKNDGSLCFTWDHWDNSKMNCVYAYETKNMVIFVNTNGKFESAVLKDNIKSGKHLS